MSGWAETPREEAQGREASRGIELWAREAARGAHAADSSPASPGKELNSRSVLVIVPPRVKSAATYDSGSVETPSDATDTVLG